FAFFLRCFRGHEPEQVVVDERGAARSRPTLEVRLLPLVGAILLVPLTVGPARRLLSKTATQGEADGLGTDRAVRDALPDQLLQGGDVALILGAVVRRRPVGRR